MTTPEPRTLTNELVELIRAEFWRPESEGKWERISAHVLSSPEFAAHVDRAVAAERAEWERRVEAAEERLRAVEALADEWETAHGNPPVDPSHISVRHARALRALLAQPAAADERGEG